VARVEDVEDTGRQDCLVLGHFDGRLGELAGFVGIIILPV